jgi:hypothetical protein
MNQGNTNQDHNETSSHLLGWQERMLKKLLYAEGGNINWFRHYGIEYGDA